MTRRPVIKRLVQHRRPAIMRRFSARPLDLRTSVTRRITGFAPHTAFAALAALSACSSVPMVKDGAPVSPPLDGQVVRDATPRNEPLSAYGNPPSYEALGKRYRVMTLAQAEGYTATGMASWYGTKFHGGRTSSGEPYDMYAMTAAHKTLPLPSYVQVTNLDNGRSAVVRINDRGPFHDDRIIDLSYAAANRLGVLSAGTARVELRLVAAPVANNAGKKVYVQAGAFAALENAESLRNHLSVEEIDSDIRSTSLARLDKTLYRVHIGPFPNRASANEVAQRLVGMGLKETLIIAE